MNPRLFGAYLSQIKSASALRSRIMALTTGALERLSPYAARVRDAGVLGGSTLHPLGLRRLLDKVVTYTRGGPGRRIVTNEMRAAGDPFGGYAAQMSAGGDLLAKKQPGSILQMLKDKNAYM